MASVIIPAMLEKVAKYLRKHPTAAAVEIAKALGVSKGYVQNHMRLARDKIAAEKSATRPMPEWEKAWLAQKADMGKAFTPEDLGANPEAWVEVAFAASRGRQDQDATQVGGSHYTSLSIQPWAAMESWMSGEQFVGYLRGNAIKYTARCDKKNGVEDVRKARHYLDKLIETMEASDKEPAW